MIYKVKRFGKVLFQGTLSQCYERYPVLTGVDIGKPTARWLIMEAI